LRVTEVHLAGLDPLAIADFLKGDATWLFRRDLDPVALARVLDAKAAGDLAGRKLAEGLGDRHLLQERLGARASRGEMELNLGEKELGEKGAGNEFGQRGPAMQVGRSDAAGLPVGPETPLQSGDDLQEQRTGRLPEEALDRGG
jgi:hypothetical protein